MYLRPDEVARVLEKAGFTMDVVTQKAYGYRRGDNYVYVNREARMGAYRVNYSSGFKRAQHNACGARVGYQNLRSLRTVPALFSGRCSAALWYSTRVQFAHGA